jgi:hypothetical protein
MTSTTSAPTVRSGLRPLHLAAKHPLPMSELAIRRRADLSAPVSAGIDKMDHVSATDIDLRASAVCVFLASLAAPLQPSPSPSPAIARSPLPSSRMQLRTLEQLPTPKPAWMPTHILLPVPTLISAFTPPVSAPRRSLGRRAADALRTKAAAAASFPARALRLRRSQIPSPVVFSIVYARF